MADDCLNCARLERLEALYATLLRDLIQIWDPTFPESPEEIYVAGGYLFRRLDEKEFARAEAGLWCLINVANDPAYVCAPGQQGSGGAQGSRVALLDAMCLIMAANDPAYSCDWEGLNAEAGTFINHRNDFIRGCIIYMLMVWESLIAGTAPTLVTLTEALAAGCCLSNQPAFWNTAVLGGGAGGNPPLAGGGLPDPVVVPSAVPAMRWAENVSIDAANDREFGCAWTIDNVGTATDGDAGSQGHFLVTLAASGTGARYTTTADWFADHSPLFNAFVFPESITDIRYFVGFTTNSLAVQLANRLPAGSYFGFVFDSGVDTNWQCVCSDGVGQTVVDSALVPSTTIRQIMRADLDFGTNALFYVDGAKVGEITTRLPLTGAAMRFMNGALNLNGAVTRQIRMLFNQAGSIGGGI